MAIKRISTQELLQWQAAGRAFKLVDVRSRDSYRQHHIPGAVSLPLGEIGQRALQLLAAGDIVVNYCAGPPSEDSTRAAELLQDLGFDEVYDYRGGLSAYQLAGGGLEQGFPDPEYSNCG